MKQNIDELLENEWFIVRHSGETPEIAYNSAIYFLSRAKDGPGLSLTQEQITSLKDAAIDRFREIILRDIHHSNVGKPIYRGIVRSIVNYQRFKKFCARQNITVASIEQDAAQTLMIFLATEVAEIEKSSRTTVINCGYDELRDFAKELKVNLDSYEEILRSHCS